MKTSLVSLFLVLCLVLCSACDIIIPNSDNTGETEKDDNNYKLTVIDHFGYLAEPLEEYYTAGQDVKVHIVFLSGPRGGIKVNGENITDYEISANGTPIYTFTMPAKDSILYTTQNGYIGIDCDDDSHVMDDGKLINATDGSQKVAYICQLCGKTETITLESTFSRAGSAADIRIYLNALNSSQIDPNTLPIYKFDTLEELEGFKATYGGESGFNFGWDEVPSFNDATKNYDEEFFKDNSLILVYITTGSGSERFSISSVSCKENDFHIDVRQTYDPQPKTEDEASWFITLTVPDSVIEGCTGFDTCLKSSTDLYTFDELYGITYNIDPCSISKVKLDYSRGIISRGMRDVMITTDRDYINSVIDFINNAEFMLSYDCYDGVGNYKVTLYTDEGEFEFSFGGKNEFNIDGYCYHSSTDFPTTGRFDTGYCYLDPLGDVRLSSYGEITILTDFDISEIHLRHIYVENFVEDYTKDADLLIQDYTVQIVSDKMINIENSGWYEVVSEKDFGELIPKDESKSVITLMMDDGRALGYISVSNNTIYTRDEMENIVMRMSGDNVLQMLNNDGTDFVDREFTMNEIITLKLEPRC